MTRSLPLLPPFSRFTRGPAPPIRLLLWGAGHAHVEVLRRFARRPPANVALTLLAREPYAPYSGMLPGLIRGEYGFDAAHIDLVRLAAAAGARLVVAEANRLDLPERRIGFADRPEIPFDLLSINIGGEPPTPDGTGTPVKPIGRLLARLAEIEPLLHPDARLAVVGAGAAGTELALALAHRLRGQVRIALVCGHDLPLPRAPERARRIAREALIDAGVELLSGVRAGAWQEGRLALSDGSFLAAAAVLWATGVVASPMLAAAGLGCDAQGAVRVDRGLRAVTHPFVFAAGDCAALADGGRPKSGVWAVRAGPVLAGNLRRAVAGRSPRPWRAQREALAILGLGRGQAVAWRNGLAVAGSAVWRVKDRIDRRWMARYALTGSRLTFATAEPAGAAGEAALEAALGRALGRALGPLAAARQPPPGFAIAQHVTHLPLVVDDPYVHGQIAAAHALSELHVLGAEPWLATALVSWPGIGAPGGEQAAEADIVALLRGASHVLDADGCMLAGASALTGPGAALGFAMSGLVEAEVEAPARYAQPGDAILLSKPLGGAVVLEGARRGLARARWRQAAIAALRRSNAAAAQVLRDYHASAMATVSGRGLGGGLSALLAGTGCAARLDPQALPVLAGVRELLARGVGPAPARLAGLGAGPMAEAERLLALPEISGGLLGVLAPDAAEPCRDALRRAGMQAAIIGFTEACNEPDPPPRWLPVAG
jgi:selenide,water dikinase